MARAHRTVGRRRGSAAGIAAGLAWGGAAAAELADAAVVPERLAMLAAVAFAAGAVVSITLLLRRRERRAEDAELTQRSTARQAPFHRLVRRLADSPALLERSHLEVLGAMASAAHAGDHETLGHSFRVARYAVALARRLGLSGEMAAALEWGALLHDVGKLSVPEEILHKVGPLSPAELEVVRQHPRHGFQMLSRLVFLGPALDVVLSHHERWDGAGYPNGLAGERIPLAARIFAAVDTYDAITSDRPYRPSRSHEEALAELRRVAGSQLDPRVVGAFVEIPYEELERLQDLALPDPPLEPPAPAPALPAPPRPRRLGG